MGRGARDSQRYEVKRGPQHFHDFPRLIVMHGAHPARLAFKLRDLSLFLPLSFLLLLLRSYASRPFPLSLSLSLNVVEQPPFRAVFHLRHRTSSSSFFLLSFLFFSSQRRRDKDAHVLPRPRKGRLMGKTDTLAGSRAKLSARVNRDSAELSTTEEGNLFLLKMESQQLSCLILFFFFFSLVFAPHIFLHAEAWLMDVRELSIVDIFIIGFFIGLFVSSLPRTYSRLEIYD